MLSLFGFSADRPPPGALAFVDGLPHWIGKQAGSRLARLALVFEPVWCTGWEDRAPEHLPRLLGLAGAPYPHLVFGPSSRHWKLDAIDAHVGPDRPVAWVDDGHDDRTEAWAAERPGPTLLVRTDPAIGLTEAQVEALEAWASGPPRALHSSDSRADR